MEFRFAREVMLAARHFCIGHYSAETRAILMSHTLPNETVKVSTRASGGSSDFKAAMKLTKTGCIPSTSMSTDVDGGFT